MFSLLHSPTDAYAKVGVETDVMAANPHKLILMLIDGALLSIAVSRQAMQDGRIADKGHEISRAIDIITNGLKASLDSQAGGDIADKLGALYEYMCTRLLQANLYNKPAILDEVGGLLNELKGAWQEIASDPAVVSNSRNIA